MMSKKSPQLRFEGFTDDWEERKLGDVLSERNDQTPETNEYPLMSFVQGKGVTPKGERYNRSFLVKDSEKKYKKTELGDFIYSSNNLETGSIGFNRTGKAVISPVYSIFKSKKSRESQFIGIMSARKDFISKMVKFRQGVVYGQWRIHESDFLNIDMKMPNDKEQQLIISFFENIDKTIALHQRKLDLLKEQKKGYLQKMFPKNGAKVPELRFAGFADDWEQRKLSDLFIKGGSGGTPKSTNKAFYDGDIPFLGISDITKSNGFINNTEKHISSDGLNSSAAWIVSKGAISLAMYASVGKLAILNIDAATSQAFYNMIFDDYDLRDLVYQRLNKANELSEWNKLISTGTQSNLNADKVKNFQMYLPKNHDEIKLISTFFKQIDNTITLHQRKLDLLKEQKKGFLQKMFV
ncbi:restriction endonuclease subunit S (plasmid) [Lactococcus lactis]|uniref:restriction endonuclease subunit S n=2 Tax=Lactococcus lactis TaxID=1358 RepID=UPI00298F4155|nr:restriction endonuclease subunit S [Lactococcus lactis]WPD51963.1 restriction endonuclease subunit S [Lactococcus lactis]